MVGPRPTEDQLVLEAQAMSECQLRAWLKQAVRNHEAGYDRHTDIFVDDWLDCCRHVPEDWRQVVASMMETWDLVNGHLVR